MTFSMWVKPVDTYLNVHRKEHLYRFNRPKKLKNVIYQYCYKHNHNIKYLTVQRYSFIQPYRESHSKFRHTRRLVELEWIRKLQTIYPFGHNGNIMGIRNISNTDSDNIFDIVSKLMRNKRSHGCNKRKQQNNNTNGFKTDYKL